MAALDAPDYLHAAGYMVDKFSLHAQSTDRRGIRVPPVPLSFLSLRVAVQRKDPCRSVVDLLLGQTRSRKEHKTYASITAMNGTNGQPRLTGGT